MLTTREMQRITVESILNKRATLRSKEALEFRKQTDIEVAEIKAKGQMPDIPGEWPEAEE